MHGVCLEGQMGFIKHKKSGAPWECARWAWDSHFWRGEPLFYFYFLHHCHRPQRSPGVHLTPFSVIFLVKDEECGSSADRYRVVVSSHEKITVQVLRATSSTILNTELKEINISNTLLNILNIFLEHLLKPTEVL